MTSRAGLIANWYLCVDMWDYLVAGKSSARFIGLRVIGPSTELDSYAIYAIGRAIRKT
jgi:hypothetical protein